MKFPTIGFIAHVDTADFEARNIQPQIHENYNGEAIVLDEEGKFVIDPKDFEQKLCWPNINHNKW